MTNEPSGDLLRILLDNLPMPVFFRDLEGRYFGCNRAFEVFLGKSASEIIGKGLNEVKSPEQASFFRKKDEELLRSQGRQVFEFEGVFGGESKNVVFDRAVFAGKDGRAEGIVGIIIDVTERKKAQKEMDERNRLLQALFDHLPSGIFMVEAPTGRPVFMNKYAEQLLGRGIVVDAAVGSFLDVYEAKRAGTDEPYPTERMPIVRAMNGEASSVNDMEVVRPDKSRVLLEIFGAPVLGSDGRVTAGLAAFNDITERRRMELKIKRHQDQLERQVGAVRDLIGRGVLSGTDRDKALRTLTETAVAVLKAGRASIWTASSESGDLCCIDVFEEAGLRHTSGEILARSWDPARFQAYMEQRVVSVDDTRRDPRMKDFPTDYLEREGILAILAAPIRAGDRVFGIFCNENKGDARAWTIEEQAFVASMSDLAALIFLMAEQREAQNKWREARDYFDKIINAVADPIFVKDREHRWVLLNNAYCDFMGYKREELLGKTDRDFFPEAEADFFWNKDDIVFETGQEVLSEERFTDAQGRAHVIMTKKVLYTDENGQKFIVGIIRDVTDLKKAEGDREKQIHDLEIFYKASVGREQRIMELKARVQELEEKLRETKET